MAQDDEDSSADKKAKTELVQKDEKPSDDGDAVKKESKKKKPAAAKEKASPKKKASKTQKKAVKPKTKKEKSKVEEKSVKPKKEESQAEKKSSKKKSLKFGISFGKGGLKIGVGAGPKVKKPETLTTNVVRFALRGEYPEGPKEPGLFGDLKPSLTALVERLDAAAKDKDVAAVWLEIGEVELGRGKLFELRQAIGRVRKAKKPVYAGLTSASTGQYLAASACDEIWMPECGILIIPGVRMEVTFFKGLLEKVGLEFDVLQMGKYKGAGEPFTRHNMSKPLRESYDAVADDVYAHLVGSIVADRKLKDYKVKTLIDEGLFTARAAHDAGLIDRIYYPDEFEETLKKKLGAEQLRVVTDYLRKKPDTDFSGIGGLVKFVQLLSGKEPGKKADSRKKIAVVYAVGPIMEGKSQSDIFGGSTLGSTTMVEALKKAAEDPKVLAVVMRVDSPGGSAVASDLIWRESLRLKAKKPFIVSMSDVAGSGGYYIAMGAQKIYATPDTITGSIGVIGGKFVTKGLYEKLGLGKEIISRGANSGAFSTAAPFSPDERKVMTRLLEEIYRQFVGKAAKGRKMSYEKLEKLAQGRIYTGQTAKRLGLIDEIGTLHDAVAAAKVAAGLKPDAEVEILTLPRPRSIFEQLFGDPAADTDLDSLLPDAVRLLRQTKLLRKIFAQPAALWIPYQVEIK
ncbi:MAG: signal peptide peptidase SppA [Pirellulales bacterium]|nr:signal peptide peptidase SppA [Pirellulales bacterium]